MSFCFIHAADLHLDVSATGISALPENLFEQVRDASLNAFDALVRLTLDKEAAFLLIGGDVYEGLNRGVRGQLRFLQGIERLSAHGVPVFMVRGDADAEKQTDHDWPAINQWPTNLTFFDSKSVVPVPVERNGERLATVYGVSFACREEKRNLALHFKKKEETSGLHVALLHCNLDHNNIAPGPCASCTLEQLEISGMDYWALGHCHRHKTVVSKGTRAVYSGTLQGRGFLVEEEGPKGAVVVQATPEGIEEIS
ncbi:MAG: DNA repair exonuclease, partial [Planctomycetota bacterium]